MDWNALFTPKSIAVIGASSNPNHFTNQYIKALIKQGFKGGIFPVNPKEVEVLGFKAYASVLNVPEEVDQAFLAVPPDHVVKVLSECRAKGVKVCVIFTSDSDSMSPTGIYGLGELISNFISRTGNPRIVGPNCLGVYCPRSGVAFASNLPKEPGNVAFISQSGGFAADLGWFGARIGLRFSKIVSYGNAVDLDLPDLLAYFKEDLDTSVVAVYVEGVKDGRRTFKELKELTAKKPVLVWKGGVTEGGAKAALSHTRSLAGSATLWNAMLKQAGAIQVESFEDLAYTSLAFSLYKPPADNRVAIVSISGGGAVASTDTCIREGLLIPQLSDTTINALRRTVPRFGTSIKNPVDAQRGALSPDACSEVLRIVLSDLNVSAAILVQSVEWSVFVNSEEAVIGIVKAVEEAQQLTGKPVLVTATPSFFESLWLRLKDALIKRGIPLFPSVKLAAKALANLYRYRVLLAFKGRGALHL